MLIGELARRHGVSRDTLRFYEKRGLIRAERGANGYRRYSDQDNMIVEYIRRAQSLGFGLSELENDVAALRGGMIEAERIREILTEKAQVIRERINALQQLEAELHLMIGQVCPVLAKSRKRSR